AGPPRAPPARPAVARSGARRGGGPRRFLDLGLYISFSGLVTRSSREELRDVARRVPADRLLIETDAPWGTPRGREGKMRPAWMIDTARVVAEVRGIGLEELAELEWSKVIKLFPRMNAA